MGFPTLRKNADVCQEKREAESRERGQSKSTRFAHQLKEIIKTQAHSDRLRDHRSRAIELFTTVPNDLAKAC
jgi:hypothetical protein